VIEVRVSRLDQLFNAIDPSPFREKDLEPATEDFIVGWAKQVPVDVPLALVVHVEGSDGSPDEPAMLREAVREFFSHRAESARQRLRELLRRGRTSLLIGLTALTVSLIVGDSVGRATDGHVGQLIRESLLIGGWVAMWRPMEIFLYDWWPIRGEAALADRLVAMPVRIAYASPSRAVVRPPA